MIANNLMIPDIWLNSNSSMNSLKLIVLQNLDDRLKIGHPQKLDVLAELDDLAKLERLPKVERSPIFR